MRGGIKQLNVLCNGNSNYVYIGDKAKIRNGLTIEIIGDNNKLIIGDNFRLGDFSKIIICGNGCIVSIGNDCAIGLITINCRDNLSSIIIGDKVDFNRNVSLISMEGSAIRIGDGVLIAYDVEIRNTDSHSVLNSCGERINPSKDIEVGNNVWIGQGVLVLKGTVLADGMIVGAKSLVTKQFKNPNSLIAGVPAVEKKDNVFWNKNR